MSTLTVSLPDPLAERLEREAKRRSVSRDVIVRQALERVIPDEDSAKQGSVFERLVQLVVADPASPTDLATNPAHLEDLGVSHPA